MYKGLPAKSGAAVHFVNISTQIFNIFGGKERRPGAARGKTHSGQRIGCAAEKRCIVAGQTGDNRHYIIIKYRCFLPPATGGKPLLICIHRPQIRQGMPLEVLKGRNAQSLSDVLSEVRSCHGSTARSLAQTSAKNSSVTFPTTSKGLARQSMDRSCERRIAP